MNDEPMEALRATLRRLAPEVDLDDVDHDADLLEELDLDSMDFLTLVEELHRRTAVEITEEHYARLDSVNAILAHLRSGRT